MKRWQREFRRHCSSPPEVNLGGRERSGGRHWRPYLEAALHCPILLEEWRILGQGEPCSPVATKVRLVQRADHARVLVLRVDAEGLQPCGRSIQRVRARRGSISTLLLPCRSLQPCKHESNRRSALRLVETLQTRRVEEAKFECQASSPADPASAAASCSKTRRSTGQRAVN